MSHNEIIDLLDDIFDGLKVDVAEASGQFVFTIEVDNDNNMILSIDAQCLSEKALSDIESAIVQQAKSLLETNLNQTVTLSADLACSV